jgi:hypothetical protein
MVEAATRGGRWGRGDPCVDLTQRCDDLDEH